MALAGGGSRRRKRARNAAMSQSDLVMQRIDRQSRRPGDRPFAKQSSASAVSWEFRDNLTWATKWGKAGLCNRAREELRIAKSLIRHMTPAQKKLATAAHRKVTARLKSCKVTGR